MYTNRWRQNLRHCHICRDWGLLETVRGGHSLHATIHINVRVKPDTRGKEKEELKNGTINNLPCYHLLRQGLTLYSRERQELTANAIEQNIQRRVVFSGAEKRE